MVKDAAVIAAEATARIIAGSAAPQEEPEGRKLSSGTDDDLAEKAPVKRATKNDIRDNMDDHHQFVTVEQVDQAAKFKPADALAPGIAPVLPPALSAQSSDSADSLGLLPLPPIPIPEPLIVALPRNGSPGAPAACRPTSQQQPSSNTGATPECTP